MARQHWIGGSFGDAHRDDVIVRICRQATGLDPGYAQAWALMALAQAEMRFWHEMDVDALASAERALALDPSLPEPYCVKAQYAWEEGRHEEADEPIKTALRLDPESWEVNQEAAKLIFRQGRAGQAIPFFEKCVTLMDNDFHNPMMLICCYKSVGDDAAVTRVAKVAVERAERVIAQDPSNGTALASGAMALAALGETQRAKDWIERSLVISPDNPSIRYNLGCTMAVHLNDPDAAIEVLRPYFETLESPQQLRHSDVDPDLDPIRDDPRFQALVDAARARLGAAPAETVAAK
jgi:adenylate cyclase